MAGPPPISDQTAAARIRDAALRQFAARGVAATSIRDVARAARVSPGLVQHHFRSKDRLRRAVEEFVLQRATAAFGGPLPGRSPAESSLRIGAEISAFVRANPDAFTYIGRSLLEGDAAGTQLLASFVALARMQIERLVAARLLRADLDRDWTALHVMLIDVGAHLLAPTLRRLLGQSILEDAGLQRMETATKDLFLKGVYRSPARAPRARRRTARG
jgi:AcrR family transcriptional regulator